jgi:hypothetical protein
MRGIRILAKRDAFRVLNPGFVPYLAPGGISRGADDLSTSKLYLRLRSDGKERAYRQERGNDTNTGTAERQK